MARSSLFWIALFQDDMKKNLFSKDDFKRVGSVQKPQDLRNLMTVPLNIMHIFRTLFADTHTLTTV